MLIDTKQMLRPFGNESDEELEELDRLIRQERETRVKLKIAKNEYSLPSVSETQRYVNGERLQAMREYQGRVEDGMSMRITAVRMIFDRYTRR